MKPRIVIVGGGHAGLPALRALRERLRGVGLITLIDRNSTSEAARGALEPLVSGSGVTFIRGTVARIDARRREVLLEDGRYLGYDAILVAVGADEVPERGHPLVERSGLGDRSGLIRTDEQMRHPDHAEVFAAGDCCRPALAYLDALHQAEIAAATIASLVGDGRSCRTIGDGNGLAR